MKRALRMAAAVIALALAGFGLTACDIDDDCDASSTTTVRYEPAAFDARVGGTSGGRGGGCAFGPPGRAEGTAQPRQARRRHPPPRRLRGRRLMTDIPDIKE